MDSLPQYSGALCAPGRPLPQSGKHMGDTAEAVSLGNPARALIIVAARPAGLDRRSGQHRQE